MEGSNTGWNNDANYQIFDAGDFLKLLAYYYWYSRDASLITEHLLLIDRVVGFVQQSREQSIKQFPPDDPRHGMVQGIMDNDWDRQTPGFSTPMMLRSGRAYGTTLKCWRRSAPR